MLKKGSNEDDNCDNFSRSDISLNSLASLEKKLKQLEHCQNLQNSLLLDKFMKKEKKKSSDVFSSDYTSCRENRDIEEESIHDSHSEFPDNTSLASCMKKTQKWTPEEVILYFNIILNHRMIFLKR